MIECVFGYIGIGILVSATSEAFIGWDIEPSPYSLVGNPGPGMRVFIVIIWPIGILMGVCWLFDKLIKALARGIKRMVKRWLTR